MWQLGELDMGVILEEYNGGGMFVALLCVALIYLFLRNRKEKVPLSKNGNQALVFYALVMALTAFNPLVANALLTRFSALDMVYYRLFWALPFACAIAYACADLVSAQKKRSGQVLLAAALVFVLVISGTPIFASPSMFRPENAYKMPGNMIRITDAIRADAAPEEPVAVYPAEYATLARQYDAGLHLAYGRSTILGQMTMPDPQDDAELTYLYRALYTGEEEGYPGEIARILDRAGAAYVVLPPGAPGAAYLPEAGFALMAEAEGYKIYKKLPGV